MSDYFYPLAGVTPFVTSDFGPRNAGGGASTNHQGLDLRAPVGSTVIAPTDITISAARQASGYGNLVEGKDASGNTYQFAHLSEMDVQAGDTITAGERIGLSGGARGAAGSGNSLAPHLHFGVKDAAGNFIDPSKILNGALNKGKATLASAAKTIGTALLLSNPITAPFAIGAKIAGVGGKSWIDQFRDWLASTGFFTRLVMVLVALIFFMAAFTLLAKGQVSKQVVKAVT